MEAIHLASAPDHTKVAEGPALIFEGLVGVALECHAQRDGTRHSHRYIHVTDIPSSLTCPRVGEIVWTAVRFMLLAPACTRWKNRLVLPNFVSIDDDSISLVIT